MRSWRPRPSARTTRYGTTNQNTSSPNARVTDAAITNAAAVAARVTTRTRLWSVSAGLSVQVNWVHAHQISQKSSTERPRRSASRLAAVSDGDLRDREHEHEVEEQLDEGDGLRLGRVQPVGGASPGS